MTEGKKTKTIPAKITFIKTENGFVGGNKQSCEILEALPENVVIFFEDDEQYEVNKQGPHSLDIKGASFKALSIDGYSALSEKVNFAILDKTKIPKHFMDDIWSGNSRNFAGLAFILKGHLAVLRQAEADNKTGKSTKAPVLCNKLLSRSELSYVAFQMLTTALSETEYDYLIELIGVLLDVDLVENRLLKNIGKKETALLTLAQFPEMSNRQLAAKIGVHHSTISRWFKEPETVKNIKSLKEMLELKKQGKFPLVWGKKVEA